MTKLVNRAKMTTATTGTGTITLGSTVDGYQTFAAAGVANSDVVRYVIEDGDAWEIGLGTYSAGTLTRGSIESSNADAALNLTGDAVVYVSAAAADLQELVDFADNFVLPTADGSTGQVLTTNGAGTLTFTTISGYTDADVDTHLNTGTASSGEVLSWTGSDYDWVTVAAALTGQTDSSSPFETSLGVGAGAVSTGIQNTFIGFEAGNDNTSGEGNTAVGYQSADSMTTGGYNAAFGVSALGGMSTGFRNVAVGAFAGASLTGNDNTAVGPLAYDAATLGSQNVAMGRDAMGVTTSNVTGNVAVGYKALEDVASDQSVAIGWSAGLNITTGQRSIAIGMSALSGIAAGLSGRDNIGIGYLTGNDLSTGFANFLGGYQAGTNLTTGSNNVALGNGAMDAATTGGRNIAIGQDAMGLGVATNANAFNVALGYRAGLRLTNGDKNIAIGSLALQSATSAGSSVAIGDGALYFTTAGGNTAVGREALFSTTTGIDNSAFGYRAGFAVTTGQNNVIVGRQAAASGTNNLTTGSNNIILGYQASASSATISNEITLGNSSITRFRVPGIQAAASDGDVLTYDATNGIMSLQAPAGGGDVVKLSRTVITSNVSTVDITLPSGYAYFTISMVNFRPSQNSYIGLRASADGGSTYLSTSGDYREQTLVAREGSFTNRLATNNTFLNIVDDFLVASTSFGGLSGSIMLSQEVGDYFRITSTASYTSSSTGNPLRLGFVAGEVSSSTSTFNSVRFFTGATALANGEITLYGHKA